MSTLAAVVRLSACCLCRDQVFRMHPKNDDEVQTLKNILGQMKVGADFFLFLCT